MKVCDKHSASGEYHTILNVDHSWCALHAAHSQGQAWIQRLDGGVVLIDPFPVYSIKVGAKVSHAGHQILHHAVTGLAWTNLCRIAKNEDALDVLPYECSPAHDRLKVAFFPQLL